MELPRIRFNTMKSRQAKTRLASCNHHPRHRPRHVRHPSALLCPCPSRRTTFHLPCPLSAHSHLHSDALLVSCSPMSPRKYPSAFASGLLVFSGNSVRLFYFLMPTVLTVRDLYLCARDRLLILHCRRCTALRLNKVSDIACFSRESPSAPTFLSRVLRCLKWM